MPMSGTLGRSLVLGQRKATDLSNQSCGPILWRRRVPRGCGVLRQSTATHVLQTLCSSTNLPRPTPSAAARVWRRLLFAADRTHFGPADRGPAGGTSTARLCMDTAPTPGQLTRVPDNKNDARLGADAAVPAVAPVTGGQRYSSIRSHTVGHTQRRHPAWLSRPPLQITSLDRTSLCLSSAPHCHGCAAPDGYLMAATQSALLEAHAGAMAAAAARS